MNKFDSFNSFDSHVILYSKSWYLEVNELNDLRHLIHKISGVDSEYIRDIDILRQVATTAYKVLSISGISAHDLDILYKDVWYTTFFDIKGSISISDQISSLLRVIRYKDTTNYPELPVPDVNILPLAKEDTLATWSDFLRG